MNRKITLILLVSIFLAAPIFAQQDLSEPELTLPPFKFVAYFAATFPGEEDPQIPEGIRNNEFYLESIRLNKLAHDTYDFGDYDASTGFAEEAIRYAQLSDEFVANQMIAEAKRLLDWADSNNIASRYPVDYRESKDCYDISLAAHSNEEWNDAISAATRTVTILSALQSGGRSVAGTSRSTGLPKQYTVRTWASVRDCLWNIAGYSWVYGDPWRWRTLYEANKSKMPNPDNPDLIEPGMIIDIPSIRGETRQGMWESGRTY